ncbi:epithelial sodium channel subunit gamma-like [Saccoglossus kowalevskii]
MGTCGNDQKNQSVKDVFSDLLANSSSHGLPNIHRSENLVGKLLWSMVFFTGLGVFCWQVSELARAFRNRDVSVQLKVHFNTSINFPAVTVCNINPVKLSALLADPELLNALIPELNELNDGEGQGNTHASGVGDGGASVRKRRDVPSNITTIDPSSSVTHVTPGGTTGFSTTSGTTTIDPSSSVTYVTPEGTTGFSATGGITTNDPSSSATHESPEGATEFATTSGNTTSDLSSSVTNVTPEVTTGFSFDWDSKMQDEHYYEQMDDSYKYKKLLRHYLSRKTAEEKVELGHRLEDMLVNCVWRGYPCTPANFTPIASGAYGNCYVFNSDSISPLKTNRPGAMYGLTLELDIDQDNYLPHITETAGIRLAIHPQNIYPFTEDNGISVPPGFASEIGLRLVTIEREPQPYGNCVEMESGGQGQYYANNIYRRKFGVDYTVQACEKSCYQNYLIATCRCSDPDYPVLVINETMREILLPCDNYDNGSDALCFDEVNVQYQYGDLNCDCPQPCSETTYIASTSFSSWPANNYMSDMNGIAERLNGIPNTGGIGSTGTSEPTQKNLVRVQIYFKELNFQSITESPAYSEFDLISDIGGQLGLWIGVSMITVCEIFQFLGVLVKLLFRRIMDKAETIGNRSTTPIQHIKLEQIS